MGKEKSIDFRQNMIEKCDVMGYWDEEYRSSIFNSILSNYKKDVIRNWHIVDMAERGDKILLHWKKRFQPLSDEELKEKFGV